MGMCAWRTKRAPKRAATAADSSPSEHTSTTIISSQNAIPESAPGSSDASLQLVRIAVSGARSGSTLRQQSRSMVESPSVCTRRDVLPNHLESDIRGSTADGRVVAVRRADELQVERKEHRPRSGDGGQRDGPASGGLGEA